MPRCNFFWLAENLVKTREDCWNDTPHYQEKTSINKMSDIESTNLTPAPAAEKNLGMRKNGKQWHAPKKAFRPTAGLRSYEKRSQERAQMAQVKAKEKEMKEEKEEERQVSSRDHANKHENRDLTAETAQGPGYQGKASQEGGEGEIREDGREDAQEASRATKAQGEAQQADQLLNGIMRLSELSWLGDGIEGENIHIIPTTLWFFTMRHTLDYNLQRKV
jgi:rRNA-processing protein CGR1